MKNLKTRAELFESMVIVDDFFNKLTKEVDKKYFPEVKYYRDNEATTKIHRSVELFNNGALTYDKLIKQLAAACKDTAANIEAIVSAYVKKTDTKDEWDAYDKEYLEMQEQADEDGQERMESAMSDFLLRFDPKSKMDIKDIYKKAGQKKVDELFAELRKLSGNPEYN